MNLGLSSCTNSRNSGFVTKLFGTLVEPMKMASFLERLMFRALSFLLKFSKSFSVALLQMLSQIHRKLSRNFDLALLCAFCDHFTNTPVFLVQFKIVPHCTCSRATAGRCHQCERGSTGISLNIEKANIRYQENVQCVASRDKIEPWFKGHFLLKNYNFSSIYFWLSFSA